MKKRNIIVVGILVFTIALLTVPLVLAGDGSASFSRSAASVEADPVEGLQAQGAISITHSLSQFIVAGNSIACSADEGATHVDNSYLRRFTLTDFGVTGDFAVTDVEMGIQTARTVDAGQQPVTITLYLWDPADPFTYANFTTIGSAGASVPDAALTHMMFPVMGTVPAGGTLVAEFFTPDGTNAGNGLWVGSNDLGETDDSFLAAAGCNMPEPTALVDIGFGDMMIVMNVYGDEVFEPDMAVNKFVGLDPSVCANNTSISVPAGGGGTDVTYCYSLENTGNVSLMYHTVDDDQLGSLLGPDYVAEVTPGSTFWFTESATITENTVNVATWSVSDGDGTVIISATDTATVTQMPPTSVALSGIEVQSTNWLVPVAFVAIISLLFGAAVVLRRRSTI